MSSLTGLKRSDGQRLTPRLASLCGGSTLLLNHAARKPTASMRKLVDVAFPLLSAAHRHDAPSRDLDAGGVPARLYEPEGVGPDAPLLVFLHGGGFVIGSIASHANLCRFTAKRARCKVLAVGYRKAPDHPFPAALDDSVTALRWALANASALGVDATRVAVGGDSAGGNLAVAATLSLSPDEPGPCHAWLIYPLVDADVSAWPSAQLFARGPLLSRGNATDMVSHYAATPREKRDPRVTVLDADGLHRMPPTYVATAGMDPLRDQGEAFADRLRGTGVEVEAERFANMPHGFDLLLIDPDARAATEATCHALQRGLAHQAVPSAS